MTWPGGPASGRQPPMPALFTRHGRGGYLVDAKKLADIRALIDSWVTAAFQYPNDAAAQTRGECAAMILRITDP